MSYVAKFFLLGLGSVGMLLVTAADVEAGCRHRHRHRHHAASCAPVQTGCCNTGYVAPVSNGCCNVSAYGNEVHGSYGYGNGQASPQMAPSGTSPSDMPTGSPPPPPAAQ